jgi:hypothetical protein
VLLGVGNAAFMRTATVVNALVGFLPLIWSGLSAFVGLRLIFVGWRTLSGRWVVTRAA